jgi:hypothetical protein
MAFARLEFQAQAPATLHASFGESFAASKSLQRSFAQGRACQTHMRLRPVMITVGATVFWSDPLAMHGGPLWEPLCYAQIGGLTAETFITLLPVWCSILRAGFEDREMGQCDARTCATSHRDASDHGGAQRRKGRCNVTS